MRSGLPPSVDSHGFGFELYGGWFEGISVTRRAQKLAAQLASFPVPVSVTDGSNAHPLIAAAEFATGLLPEPRVFLTHTFRPRSGVAGISCAAPPFTGCVLPGGCAIASVYGLVAAGQCPEPGCPVIQESLLSRAEQKLVDTLLVADLLHLAHANQDPIAVVSTDDDMWPGIRLALLQGTPIFHIHPVPRRQTPSHYLVALPAGYNQATLN